QKGFPAIYAEIMRLSARSCSPQRRQIDYTLLVRMRQSRYHTCGASMMGNEDTTMKVACYVRVSTRRQKDDGQRSEIQQWLTGNGIDSAQVEWFADKESGSTLQRPEFDRLQKAIFNGEVKTVVLWKLDRLSRRLNDGVNTLAAWCEKGIKVVVVTQQLEFNGAVGRTLAAVMLGLAEIELEYRRERQAAGITVA